jgi:hypothetical protein
MSRTVVERTNIAETGLSGTPQVLLRWGDTANRFAMQRVERRVGFRLFGRWFGYESSRTDRQVETIQLTEAGKITTAPLPGPHGRTALAGGGVIAIALLGVAIGMLIVPTAPRATSRDLVLATLPASRPILQRQESVLRRRPMVAAVHATPTAALASAVPVPALPSGTLTIDDSDTATAPVSLTLAQARASALSSGDPAYWAEGNRSGVVVAGPERPDNGQLCRLVAVFTRMNGDRGSSQSTMQCRAMGH